MRTPNGYPSRKIVVYTNGIYYVWTDSELKCRAAFDAEQLRWWAILRTWILLLPLLWRMGR